MNPIQKKKMDGKYKKGTKSRATHRNPFFIMPRCPSDADAVSAGLSAPAVILAVVVSAGVVLRDMLESQAIYRLDELLACYNKIIISFPPNVAFSMK